MKPVKKIEIIAGTLPIKEVIRVLESVGVSGYTVIRGVTGKGERGLRAGDELTDVLANSYVLTACPEEQAQRVVEAVRPVLQRFGGVCLVSDAQWIVH